MAKELTFMSLSQKVAKELTFVSLSQKVAKELTFVSLSQKVAKGKEVFNTYGQKENAKLLAEYGFVVRPRARNLSKGS